MSITALDNELKILRQSAVRNTCYLRWCSWLSLNGPCDRSCLAVLFLPCIHGGGTEYAML